MELKELEELEDLGIVDCGYTGTQHVYLSLTLLQGKFVVEVGSWI